MKNSINNNSGKYIAIDGPLKGATIPLNSSLNTFIIKKGKERGYYRGHPGGVSGPLLKSLNIEQRMKNVYRGRALWVSQLNS